MSLREVEIARQWQAIVANCAFAETRMKSRALRRGR